MNELARPIASLETKYAPGETFGCTPKEIAFARHVQNGETFMDAVVKAGYAVANKNVAKASGSKIAARPRVAQLIAHMRHIANTYSTVTVESLTAELEEARQLAIECEQPSAVTAAIMAKAKLHGLDINRTQTETRVSVAFDGAAEKLFHALSARQVIEGVGEKVEDAEELLPTPTHPPQIGK